MERPQGDLNKLLSSAKDGARYTHLDQEEVRCSGKSQLSYADDRQVMAFLEIIRSGVPSIIVVRPNPKGDQLQYIFVNCSKPEAVQMLGYVLGETGKRMI